MNKNELTTVSKSLGHAFSSAFVEEDDRKSMAAYISMLCKSYADMIIIARGSDVDKRHTTDIIKRALTQQTGKIIDAIARIYNQEGGEHAKRKGGK